MNKLNEPLTFSSSFNWRNPIIRNTTMYLIALAIVAGALALILFSPLLLDGLTHARGIDWSRLSNIGQTYGAASAVLSGIALVGVSLSLLVQARQAKVERIRIARERHMELLRIALDAPDVYGPVIGLDASRSTIDTRQFLFSTMWVNYARVGFQMGVLSEDILHDDIFGPAFRNEPIRKWWVAVRKVWSDDLVPDRRERRFVQIIDEEYRKALIEDRPIALKAVDPPPNARTTLSAERFNVLTGAVLGVAIGVVVGSRLRHNRH